jgi:mRNA interferase RelE/StbE
MKRYKIALTRSATKELGVLPDKTHDNIIEHLRQLEADPRMSGAEKLTGMDAYKLRVGNYRIVYQIDDTAKEIRVVMVEDRKQVYKRLRRKR